MGLVEKVKSVVGVLKNPRAPVEGAPAEKFILRSRRLWATVLVAVGALLPAARALGLDIPADVFKDIGDLGNSLLTALGLALAVWSRLRPDYAKRQVKPIAAVLLLLLGGCASQHTPREDGNTVQVDYPDGRIITVSMDQRLYSAGLATFTVSPEGIVEATVCQTGTSDYGGIRLLAAVLPQSLMVVSAFINGWVEMAQHLVGMETQKMQAPTEMRPCDFLYEG